jgi:protein Mpv17
MMGMKGAWVWYRFRLQQQPIRTQMVTSGILWAIGDAIAQSISRSIEQRLVMKENSTTIVSVHTIMASLLPLHLFSFF